MADEGDESYFRYLLTFEAARAPTNTPGEFLALCGAVGFGRLLAEGQANALEILRQCANDPRWRIREGVVIGLQRLGDQDMDALIHHMQQWSRGSLLEQRAAAAALCEPRLLKNQKQIRQVLAVLDRITMSIIRQKNLHDESFQALRKGLAYCWSVAVVASPEQGKPILEKWLTSADKDVRWIMKENLKKDRLKRMDTVWVETTLKRLG